MTRLSDEDARTSPLWIGLALVLFVGLRLLVSTRWSVELVDHEQLYNLRLGRQLLGGFELGPLGDYWFTGMAGGTGGGPFLLSLVYVPVVALFGSGVASIHAVALLFDVLTFLGLVGIGHELRGNRGATLAAAAALAAPPSWLWFGLVVKGNYLESAAFIILTIWLLLRASRSGLARDGFLAGLLAAFGTWVSALGLVFLLPALVMVRLARARMHLRAVAGGALLGASPFVLGPKPTMLPEPVFAADVAISTAVDLLTSPLLWPEFLLRALAGVEVAPLARVASLDSGTAIGPIVAIGMWMCTVAWLFLAVRGRRPAEVWTAGTAVFMSVGLVLALAAIGMGGEELPVSSNYGFDARRLTLVYPLWALAVASLLARLTEVRARLGTALLLAGVGVAAAALFAGAGAPAPDPFRPESYVVCPWHEPKDEVDVCVDPLDRSWVVALEDFVDTIDGSGPVERRAALEGWAAVTSSVLRCGRPRVVQPPAPETLADWWRGAGAAGTVTCEAGARDRLCETAPTEVARRACGGE